MRLLIDESLPRHLAAELTGHEVSTVRGQRWSGLRNGTLLRAARNAGFEVVISADHSIPHQKNIAAIGIAVIILRRVRNRMTDLRPLIPKILEAVARIQPGEIIEVSR